MHSGAAIHGSCNSDKHRIVPYFGSGGILSDFVNEAVWW